MKKRNLQNVFSSLERTNNQKKLLPLKLQLFGDDGKGGQEEIDYKALYEKTKAEKDKASKEASDYKKALKAKETEEETKAREDESKRIEMEENMAKILKENQTFKLQNHLQQGNVLNSEDISKIVEARYSDNDENFAKTLNEIIKKKIEEKEASLREEFKRNGRVPSGSGKGSSTNETEEFAKNLANKYKTRPNREKFSKYFD